MKTIIVFFLFLLFCGCQSKNSDSSKSTEQLKQEVLGAACTDEMRQEFEEEIDSQSKILDENQLKNSLINMKTNIRCDE